jgi:uncharacterized membrane protein YccC
VSETDHGWQPSPGGQATARVSRALDAVTPGWLAEVVKTQRAPVPWLEMLRVAIVIGLPLAIGLAAGRPIAGVLVTTGALLGSVVDRGGPYQVRVRRITCAALLGGVPGLILGGLIHGRGWLAVLVLIAVAGVSAVMSALGDVASVTGLQLLVYTAFGMGPLGAIRPWWTVPVLFLCGVAWAMVTLLPGWLLSPHAGEEQRVAAVYRALAGKLDATGTGGFPAARRAVTAALNAAYDEVLTARAASGGRDQRLARLVALLNQAHRVAEATTALAVAGERPPPEVSGVVRAIAAAIDRCGPLPATGEPPVPAGAGLRALQEGITGAVDLLTGRRPLPPPRPAGVPDRIDLVRRPLARVADELRGGGQTRVFALRLIASIGVAAVFSEVLPLQRSYWVVLTVAIILKPDFGSVFARALQRGTGTVVGAVIGALLLAALPAGPVLVIPLAVFAALLPYGRSRNYGLFSVFLTPMVVLLIDLLARQGWTLAEARLIDTLAGCAIALLVGYAPWPGYWHADIPRKFADAAGVVARYTECALLPGRGRPRVPHPAGAVPGRAALRRQAYRALSDLRLEFQRAMAEPAAVSRLASAWWPATVALEQVVDAVTAVAVAADHGLPLPPSGPVERLAAALRGAAAAARGGQPPPPAPDVTGPGPLAPAANAVRGVLDALAGSAATGPGARPTAARRAPG